MILRCSAAVWVVGFGFGCCEVTQIVHPAAAALDAVAATDASSEPRAYVGVALEENVSGALDDLVIGDGLRVARVEKGSPAETVGLKRGDLVTKANGGSLRSLDQWGALLATAHAGQHIALEIDRDGGVREADVVVASTGGATLAEPTRFAERAKARVIVETVMVPGAGPSARVVELLAGSPFRAAGVAVGDTIRAIDGEPMLGAEDFVRSIADEDAGSTIEVDLVHGTESRAVAVTLLEPPRVLTGFGLPILFHFDRDLAADTTEFAIADLWFLALYDYRREGEARRHRILRWIRWQTGEGTLSEESS